MTSFSIQSFGCRVNQAESFAWADEFQKRGLRYEKDCRRSDLVLVNTCTVTRRADSDFRAFLRRMQRANPGARLVLTGCLTERVKEDWGRYPQVWKVVSNRDKDDLWEMLFPGLELQPKSPARPFRSRALVKIQEGCDLDCRFCIVPKVRGPSTSRAKTDVMERVRAFLSQGYEEIVLTGVHLCLYGRDSRPKASLLELLEELEEERDLKRIRLSSLDPRFMDEALLTHLTSSLKVCPHFHLSLQSGADSVLSSMGRKISVSAYHRILSFFRDRLPQASLGADILTGFPGESDEDFQETYRFLEKSPLTYFHVFVFSPRPGTPAADWTQVAGAVKAERSYLLRELSKEKNWLFRKLLLGRIFDAVVIRKGMRRCQALTSNYIKVLTPMLPCAEREIITLKISRVTRDETFGETTATVQGLG